MTLIEKNSLTDLKQFLKRTFALPLCRSTFRELQNALLAASQNNQEMANTLFEGLLSGQFNKAAFTKEAESTMEALIEEFGISCRLAKDIFERGDFISLITCDTLTQQNKAIFLNRLRKVDGEEFQFIIDPQGALYMLHHFITRLEEFKKIEGSQKQMEQINKELEKVKARLDAIMKQEASV